MQSTWAKSSIFKNKYLLTPWRRFLLDELIISQLVKKFPSFYGTQRFSTMFSRAHHLSLMMMMMMMMMMMTTTTTTTTTTITTTTTTTTPRS
jgi:hypothetical protein